MATQYRIETVLDPSGVTAGAAKVKQDLRGVDTTAASTSKAIQSAFDQQGFDRSIGNLITRLDRLDTNLGEIAKTSAGIQQTNTAVARSLDAIASAAGRAAAPVSATDKAARSLAAAEREVEAAARRVIDAVDQEAAGMARLNALLADAKVAHDAGRISTENYAKVQKLAADGAKGATASLGQQRAGYQQLGFQVQDITQSLTLGISPATVFAQQAGQTASAIGLMTNSTKGFIGFLGGPYGAIAIAATALLVSMAEKFYKLATAEDEALKKLKEDYKESENARRAKEIFGNTLEGVTDALRKNRDALKALNDEGKTAARRALEEAIAAKDRLANIRNETDAQLKLARSLLEVQQARAIQGGTRSEVAAQGVQGRFDAIKSLEDRIGNIDRNIAEADRQINDALSRRVAENARGAADPLEQIKKKYEGRGGLIDLARRQASADEVRNGTLRRQIDLLVRKQRVEEEAARAAQRNERSTARDASTTTSFLNPVVGGRVSSGFGPRRAPTAGASTFHKGIDIAAPTGTPVRAAAGGVVVYAGRLGGLGNAIIVDHGNGTITEYGHLSKILTAKNARVGAGENIGQVGSTGVSTGPHLDYRVKVGGRYVDPRGGRFRTDETAVGVRAANAAQTAAEKAERDAERQRDFVTGIEDQARGRGISGRAGTLQAQIAKALADFKRQFDREANSGERTRITDALTEADARETANRFDEAYTRPLQRLQALQGKTGQDRAILNAQLEETDRLGRALTPVEAERIANGIRQTDALTRESAALEAVRAPLQAYRDEIATLEKLLAAGAISQESFNARVGALGTSASQFKAGLPGLNSSGVSFAEQGQRDASEQQRRDDLAALQQYLDQGLILETEANAVREGIAQAHANRLRDIDRARFDVQLQGAASTADSLLQIAEDTVGKQSAVYKGLFVATKAFAIAEAIINIQRGISQAAALPFPANIPAIASVVAATASIVSNIQSVALNLADGGQVRRAGGRGMLRGPGGPRGDKIPVNGSDGEFMVNAAAVGRGNNLALLEAVNSGRITATARRATARAAANDVAPSGRARVTVFNQAAGTEVEETTAADGSTELTFRRIAREEARKQFQTDIRNPNSRTSKTMRQTTTTGRRRG